MKKLALALLCATIATVPACLRKKIGENRSSGRGAAKLGTDVDSAYDYQDIDEYELADDALDPVSAETGVASADFTWDQVDQEADNGDFDTVYFGFDEYKISADQQPIVAHDIDVAKSLADSKKTIVIEGHADKIGANRAYNLALSEKRAQTVAQELQSTVPTIRIETVGRGQEMPADATAPLTKSAQRVNRRATIQAL